MKRRCLNENYHEYHYYGGRGIMVAPEFMEYESFAKIAVQKGYEPGLWIDRIDPNGHYAPDNIRFVTAIESNRNRRDNLMIEAWGETKCLSEWATDPRCLVERGTAWYRIVKAKMKPEEAFTQESVRPHGDYVAAWDEKKTIADWLKDERCKASASALYHRIRRGKMTPEDAISKPSK